MKVKKFTYNKLKYFNCKHKILPQNLFFILTKKL